MKLGDKKIRVTNEEERSRLVDSISEYSKTPTENRDFGLKKVEVEE
ncbi:hypothetical protein [Peptoniphilus sp. HCN-40583]